MIVHPKPNLRPNAAVVGPLPDGVTLREYRESDRADLLRLYHEGLLSESVNPMDPALDEQFISATYLSRPQDHLWVAEAHGKVVACVGVTEVTPQVTHVRRLRVDRDWQTRNDGQLVRVLLATAAEHAQLHDQLKLVMHTPVNDERAVAFLHRIGFEFARIRDREGRHLLEFYLNIYQPPLVQTGSLPAATT